MTTTESYVVDYNDLFTDVQSSKVGLMGHNGHHSYLRVWLGDNRHISFKSTNKVLNGHHA